MSHLTSSETLTELRRYFDTFDAMQEAICARRKFPKREQKIIVAYKGRIDAIKDCFAPIGRL